jgi:phosphoenolpyruvate carboxykinase (ATP)
VLHAPSSSRSGAHGTRTSTFIVLNLAKRMILIGGTRYAGELKKSMFTVMNYFMPKHGVLSMHCSANIGTRATPRCSSALRHRQDHAVRRSRALAHRDDEHGWSDAGVFNYEGGLLREGHKPVGDGEPDIFATDTDVRHGPRERRAR